MAAHLDLRRKQRGVIECVFLKGEIAANIQRSLLTISGTTVFDVRTICLLISRVNGNPREKGESNLSDMIRCIVNEYKPKHLHTLITGDRKLREFFYGVHVNLEFRAFRLGYR